MTQGPFQIADIQIVQTVVQKTEVQAYKVLEAVEKFTYRYMEMVFREFVSEKQLFKKYSPKLFKDPGTTYKESYLAEKARAGQPWSNSIQFSMLRKTEDTVSLLRFSDVSRTIGQARVKFSGQDDGTGPREGFRATASGRFQELKTGRLVRRAQALNFLSFTIEIRPYQKVSRSVRVNGLEVADTYFRNSDLPGKQKMAFQTFTFGRRGGRGGTQVPRTVFAEFLEWYGTTNLRESLINMGYRPQR